MRVALIVPAAGMSTRFGAADKLQQDVGGRSLLLRAIEPFTKLEEVTSTIVAGPPREMDIFREQYGAKLGFLGAQLVPGSTGERWETVQAALEHVPDEATHIAVHDAARPIVDEDLLKRVFEAALSASAPLLRCGGAGSASILFPAFFTTFVRTFQRRQRRETTEDPHGWRFAWCGFQFAKHP